MRKPSYKTTPDTPLLIFLTGHNRTIELVVLKYFSQLGSSRQIQNKSIDFIIIMETTAVQVRTAHRTEPFVHHHDFRMMKAPIEHIDVCSSLTQLIGYIKPGIGSKEISDFPGIMISTRTPRSAARLIAFLTSRVGVK